MSIDYAAAFNWTKIVGNSALPDAFKLSTYTFWSLGGGTSQPPGAWVQIALLVSPGDSLPIAEKARLLALVSLAMVDARTGYSRTSTAPESSKPRT